MLSLAMALLERDCDFAGVVGCHCENKNCRIVNSLCSIIPSTVSSRTYMLFDVFLRVDMLLDLRICPNSVNWLLSASLQEAFVFHTFKQLLGLHNFTSYLDSVIVYGQIMQAAYLGIMPGS